MAFPLFRWDFAYFIKGLYNETFACTALLFDCISLISIRIYYYLACISILYRIRRLFVPLSLLSSCCEKVQLVIIVENSTRTKLHYTVPPGSSATRS